MPHIRIRGLSLEEVKLISTRLLQELVILTGVTKDHFTLEHVESTFFVEGIKTGRYPFVEINWFYRGDEIMKEAAIIITNLLEPFEYDDVAVYFNNLTKHHYFENGEHF